LLSRLSQGNALRSVAPSAKDDDFNYAFE